MRFYGFIRAQRRVEARGRNRQKTRAMQVGLVGKRRKGGISHVRDSVGLRKMQNFRWDFVQNVIISPRDPCSSKRGAGGVGMPPPNWNRQLCRHQCRSHFPANPDGPVAMPEASCCKREGGERGTVFYWEQEPRSRGLAIPPPPRVPPLDRSTGHSSAAARSMQPQQPSSKTSAPNKRQHARRDVRRHASIFASLLHHIRNLSTANGRSVQTRESPETLHRTAVAPPLSSKELGFLAPRQILSRRQPLKQLPFPTRSSRRPPPRAPTALQKQDSTLHSCCLPRNHSSTRERPTRHTTADRGNETGRATIS